jgi:hypothetical protein
MKPCTMSARNPAGLGHKEELFGHLRQTLAITAPILPPDRSPHEQSRKRACIDLPPPPRKTIDAEGSLIPHGRRAQTKRPAL